MNWLKTYGPGLLYVLLPAIAAEWLGTLLPIVGGPVFGIILGVILNHTYGKPAHTAKGILFTSKKILQWAIIGLGAGLSLTQVWKTGVDSLSVMLLTLLAAFAAAYGIGRVLGVPLKLQSLIGVGTAICGGSAIAAISPIIEAEEQDIAYAVSTIFLFNIAAVLLFPALGHMLGFSQNAFGLWAGTAINDTSSVVAAGYIYGNEAGAYATIVKLTRTTMIIPIALLFAFIVATRRSQSDGARHVSLGKRIRTIFPWFIVWFLLASLLHTVGAIPETALPAISWIGKFMIVMALTAIGLQTDLRKLAKTGFKPILLGLIVWFVVAVISVAIQYATGRI